MALQQSVLRRFRERLADAAAGSTVVHPRRWRAFRPAVRLRHAANDNRAPLGLVVVRVLLITVLIGLGLAVAF